MNVLSNRLNSLSPSATLAMSQKSAELKAQGVDVINLRALKDVARVQKLPIPVSNQLCKWVPDRIPDPNDKDKLLKINLKNAINAVPEMSFHLWLSW